MLFLFLSIQEPVCVDDCGGYVVLMGMSPWKTLYWVMLHKTFRGWTIPVFFSAFGRYGVVSAQVIVVAQALLLLAASGVFAMAVVHKFAPRRRWWIGATIAAMVAFQQGYLLFCSFLLSDSLAWALVLFLLAAVLAADRLLQRLGCVRYAVLYLALGSMAIGARDANQQLFIGLTTYLLAVEYARLTRTQLAGMIVGVGCICAVQGHWAQRRFYVNLENVLVGRMLPDPEARRFLLQHGMPPAYAALGESLPLQPLDAVNTGSMFDGRRKLELIGNQYITAVPQLYALWLFEHPVRTGRMLFEARATLFVEDFLWIEAGRLHLATVARRLQTGSEVDDRPETPYFVFRHKLLLLRPSLVERIPLSVRFALLMLLPAWGIWRNARAFFASVGGFALLIGALGVVNACSGFLADAWGLGEMERHAAIGNMLFNAGILLLLLWAEQEVESDFAVRQGRDSSKLLRPRASIAPAQ